MRPEIVKQTLRVAQRIEDAEDVVVLELVSDDDAPLPEFSAGAHLDIYLGNNLVRQYSICSDPADRYRYRLGILRETKSRGGSSFVHANINEGDLVEVGLPRNNFLCNEAAKHSVLIAGGIGITPILAMAHRLDALGADYSIHYCCRSPERVAFRSVLVNGPFAPNVKLHLGDNPSSQRFSFSEEVGAPEPGAHVYVCGPAGFTDAILASARDFGWPDALLHTESFTAQTHSEAGDRPLKITALRSGVTVEVAADQSIAAALVDAGIDIPLACEQGICGTCVTGVLEGEPLHRDEYLSDEEKRSNKVMTVCCSRARSEFLVLDV